MTWTLLKPTKSGWYWFREPGLNLDKPLPAWVYQSGQIFYVKLCGAHEDFDEKRLSDLKGEWAGPIIPPAVFEERARIQSMNRARVPLHGKILFRWDQSYHRFILRWCHVRANNTMRSWRPLSTEFPNELEAIAYGKNLTRGSDAWNPHIFINLDPPYPVSSRLRLPVEMGEHLRKLSSPVGLSLLTICHFEPV